MIHPKPLQKLTCEAEMNFLLGNPITIESASDNIESLLGYSQEDFLNHAPLFQSIIHPDDCELCHFLFVSKICDTRERVNFRIRKKNGLIQCLRVSYTKIISVEDSACLLQLSLSNVGCPTSFVEDQLLLANFSAMMETTDDYIFFKDRHHVFTGASQTLVAITEPSEHWTDLIGLTDYDVFSEHLADQYYSLEKQVFSGAVKVAHEIQPTLTNNGHQGWVDNRKYPIKDTAGNIIGLFGIARDITALKQLEQVLIEKITQLETSNKIFDEAGDAIALIKDRHFFDCNKAALKLFRIKDKAYFTTATLINFSPKEQPNRCLSSLEIKQNIAMAIEKGVHRFEWVNQRQDGSFFDADITLTAIYINGETIIHAHWRDVTERKRMQQALEWQAMHDPLTNLPNRVLLTDRFNRAISEARKYKRQSIVCMLDLDKFKSVNDSFGHETGDKLLILVGERIKNLIRTRDTVGRIGGDEFVLLLCDLKKSTEMDWILQRIIHSLAQPYSINSYIINITVSMGAVIFPSDDSDSDILLRHADQAMYQAKQAGSNRFSWFDSAQDKEEKSSLEIINRVKEALEKEELCFFYQPKVNMRTHKIVGMEALLRWQHPDKGLIPPLDFLPLIEETDVIIDIGEWGLQQALKQIQQWNRQGHYWVVSVNIAARHFQLHDFFSRFKAILDMYPDVSPEQLEIEILESVAINDFKHVHDLIISCQNLGVKFSLDDFGAGYSSLSYLKRLPANTIKIDQSFVRDILEDKDDLILVKAVIGLAHNFKRQVIAEGVETEAHGDLLLKLGCDFAQGYGIAKPMSVDRVNLWFTTLQKTNLLFNDEF